MKRMGLSDCIASRLWNFRICGGYPRLFLDFAFWKHKRISWENLFCLSEISVHISGETFLWTGRRHFRSAGGGLLLHERDIRTSNFVSEGTLLALLILSWFRLQLESDRQIEFTQFRVCEHDFYHAIDFGSRRSNFLCRNDLFPSRIISFERVV